MMKMNWTHSSRAVTLALILVMVLSVVGPATAADVSVNEQPETVTEGEDVSTELTVENPHPPSEWTLVAETELENPQWSVEGRNINSEVIQYDPETSSNGQRLEITVSSEQSTDEIDISVSGQAPTLSESNLSYEDIDNERYNVVSVTQNGSPIENGEVRAHRYIADSRHQEARETLSRIEEEISGNSGAEERFNTAVSLYNSGSFEEAIDEAENADSEAESSEQTQTLLFVGAGVVVLLLLAGGGYYVYQQRSRNTNKLQ